jgi:hypothetical protein
VVQFSQLKGRLADVALPNSGFASTAPTRAAWVDVGNPRADAYALAPGDRLTIFADDGVAWSGELAVGSGPREGLWTQRDVDAALWRSYFDRGCACALALASPTTILRYGPPEGVPSDVDAPALQAALRLHARILAGELRPGEIPAHLGPVDPVVALFLVEQIVRHAPAASVPLARMRPALAEIARAVRSRDPHDAPRWMAEARRDAVYEWLVAAYDAPQFEGHLEAGVRLLLDKIDG